MHFHYMVGVSSTLYKNKWYLSSEVARYRRLRPIPTIQMNITNKASRESRGYPKNVIREKKRLMVASKMPVFFLFFHSSKSQTKG